MADAFYTALVTFDDVIENTEEVSQILEDTVWEDPNVSLIRFAGPDRACTNHQQIFENFM